MEKISRYFKDNVQLLSQLKANGVSVYPKFGVSMSLRRYIEKYSGLENGERMVDVKESLAGRILGKHRFRDSITYYLHGGGEKIQVRAQGRSFGTPKHGDIIGVTGFPGKGTSGELAIYPESLKILSPCLHSLPQLPKGDLTTYSPGSLRDPSHYILKQEARARYRFLDLILNKDVRSIFEIRSNIIRYVRNFLDDREFQEVETPILNTIPGCGAVSPFVTNHKDTKLYLRVAPELNLKKVLVGGLDRVYEIGKQFRNEGIDPTHNPEFTSCELYMTYVDYEYMIELTEQMLSGLVKDLTGSFIVKCKSNGVDKEGIAIDFTPPFRRVDFLEELKKQIGVKIPDDLGSEETNAFLKVLCDNTGVECKPPQRTASMLDKLADRFLVPNCEQPTFIINHPKVMSPMAKSHQSNPNITERFEFYVNQLELCNAYTELNDPQEQRERFSDLMMEFNDGEHEAKIFDEQFLEALEYGLPPTAGWGLGIDRLVMLLTSSTNIKDVMLFPLMRPKGRTRERTSANEP